MRKTTLRSVRRNNQGSTETDKYQIIQFCSSVTSLKHKSLLYYCTNAGGRHSWILRGCESERGSAEAFPRRGDLWRLPVNEVIDAEVASFNH